MLSFSLTRVLSCLILVLRLSALNTEKEPQQNREKERGEEDEEEGRQLGDQQSNGWEETEEEMEMDEQELEGVQMNDTRREALSKREEKEDVQRVMKQMLRSLYGMLKHEKAPESHRSGFEMKIFGKQSNRGWIPEPKNTPLWIPNSKKLTMAKRNTVPMIG